MKNIIGTILFLVVAIGIVVGFIVPHFNSVGALRQRKTELNQTLMRFRELRDVRDNLLARYNSILQSDIDRLQKMLPQAPDTGSLLTELDQLTRSHALLLRSVELGETAAAQGPILTGSSAGPAERLHMTLRVVGPYASFRSFLNDLEHSLRLIDVSSLAFSVSEENINEYGISASSYWFNTKK